MVLDDRTLLIPDAPGNNRLDTLENIRGTGKIGLFFMIPGIDETLRINGAARLSSFRPCGSLGLADDGADAQQPDRNRRSCGDAG